MFGNDQPDSYRSQENKANLSKLVVRFMIPIFVLFTGFTALILVLTQKSHQANPSNNVQETAVAATTTPFRFISFADTKTGYTALAAISNQIHSLPTQPNLLIYEGDVQETGFDTPTISTWTNAFNGNNANGTTAKLFLVRGNHDNVLANSSSSWQNYYNFSSIASVIGASNYTYLSGQDDLTYSFDYNNAHFVGIDSPGDNTLISSAQITWLNQDLTSAEARDLTHAFIFFHGPLYYTGAHPASPNAGIITAINNHPIVSAIFVGHEHIMAYNHLDNTHIPGLTRTVEQFVTGNAGANMAACTSSRILAGDYCQAYAGFSTIDVNGGNYTVSFYKQGTTTPDKTWNFSKIIPSPTPTADPGAYDLNDDGILDTADYQLFIQKYQLKDPVVDFTANGVVNILDYNPFRVAYTNR